MLEKALELKFTPLSSAIARPSSAVWSHTEYVCFLFRMTTFQIFGDIHHVILWGGAEGEEREHLKQVLHPAQA